MDLHSGIVKTIAGNGNRGIPEDGTMATEAPLVDPRAVCSDEAGNVYVLGREVMPCASFAQTEKFTPLRATETKGAPMALVH